MTTLENFMWALDVFRQQYGYDIKFTSIKFDNDRYILEAETEYYIFDTTTYLFQKVRKYA